MIPVRRKIFILHIAELVCKNSVNNIGKLYSFRMCVSLFYEEMPAFETDFV
jgi:hypothetical protein